MAHLWTEALFPIRRFFFAMVKLKEERAFGKKFLLKKMAAKALTMLQTANKDTTMDKVQVYE